MMAKPLNYYQITEKVGTSGQPSKEQFSDIAQMGYEAVVNLAMHDSENTIPEEGGIVAGFGMAYFHIPVPFENLRPITSKHSVASCPYWKVKRSGSTVP
ncbi:MAG: hypothetical protein E4H15_00920 [Syntrophobacterales bacterium]|nr:MAG: hypothetical protein E4H15_00920 [Syntrophobacterales bacterium]